MQPFRLRLPAERQRELLDPLLELLRSEFGIEAVTSSDYIPPPQSVVAITFLEQALISLDNWHLAAVDSLANATRSVTIGLLLSRGLISLEAAMAAARLEEDFQVPHGHGPLGWKCSLTQGPGVRSFIGDHHQFSFLLCGVKARAV